MQIKLALLFTSGLIFSALTSIQLSVIGQETPANPSETTHQYPQDYVRNYLQDCIQTSMGEGLAEAEAKTLCDCTLNKFQQKYSLQEFKQLTATSETDDTAANALIEVGELCFETILFES